MAPTETLIEFYQHKIHDLPANLPKETGHFNVFRMEDCPVNTPVTYNRRDFFKITLLRGHFIYHYADKSIELSGANLLFFNPKVPYTWEMVAGTATGYFCIFTEAFFTEKIRGSLHDLPMFALGGKTAYSLTESQDQEVSQFFEKMLAEINSDYLFKYDLLRNYVTELTHFALKTQPSETLYEQTDANARLTAVFHELLERQFPIETPAQRFRMRSAKNFADQLAVHVNHLNRAIRKATGKTTTELISDRLVSEAKALLKHTDWNVSEISYSLGFEEPAHFSHFFKKHTSFPPSYFRRV
ncbi:helix-turn-helix domain-containing protein [Adhaeribacter pallidiroseus]|uniref:HTH-type transcriptional activator RhaS n=1 Tax=Adhaeribacter pallidiroseus TaxID=2072847 RepID=A0A369QKQ0_9BACT|nr:helix-turn-helix transcriptional regulator [Adhaeribacter pallidiroseus]RDC64962.1 HTH-type transcriptional activator RhaS [Adhaeribacter pallidiroseus]